MSGESFHIEGGVRLSAVSGVLFAVLLAACLFLSYPLALFVPVRPGAGLLGFYFALPTFFLFSLAACGWLLLEFPRRFRALPQGAPALRHDPARLMLAGFALFACSVILNAWLMRSSGAVPVVEMLGMAAVPLFFALRPAAPLRRLLPPLLAALWLALAVHGIWQWAVGMEVVGIAGNRNWMAVLVLALAPWAWQAVAGGGMARRWGAALLPAAVSLLLAWKGESRAAWVMLASYVFFFLLFPRLSWKGRVSLALGALAAAAALAAVLLTPARMERIRAGEIRPSLWIGTLRLVADHPLAGVGAGNFRREFPACKQEEQKHVTVAAAVTEHPHCEPLRMAAETGIPLALLWLLLWLPLWRPPEPGGFGRAVHFGAWMVCGTALLDKALVQPPSGLLGLMFLGLLWNSWLGSRFRTDSGAPFTRRPVAMLVAVLFAAAGLWLGTVSAAASWWQRRAMLADSARDFVGAYDAWCRAARWNPHDVTPPFRAGAVALRGLHRPDLALKQFADAVDLEPDYAHLNGEIGAALGEVRRTADALPYLRRDAALYPCDPATQRRLIVGLLDNGLDGEALRVAAALPALDQRRAVQRLGAGELRRLTAKFLRAMEAGDGTAALGAAAELASPKTFEWLDDPLFPGLCRKSGFPVGFAERFDPADFLYWQECFAAKTAAPSPADDLRAFQPAADGSRVLRIRPFDFCARHQILANILQAGFGTAAPTPWFGVPPSLRLARCRMLAGEEGKLLRVEFDLQRRAPVRQSPK